MGGERTYGLRPKVLGGALPVATEQWVHLAHLGLPAISRRVQAE